jgi:putative methionine-R-sulfoxide reductase with GAF domain
MIAKRLALLLVLVFGIISINYSAENTIKNGILNLQLTNFEKTKPIKIQGEVEFYWDKLLTPSQLHDTLFDLKPQLVTLPKSWTSYMVEGKKLPAIGFATFRFWVVVNSSNSQGIYGLRIPTVFSSYRVWANGRMLSEVGTVSERKAIHTPKFRQQDIPIVISSAEGKDEKIEIVVQVSNFSHRRAGLAWPMYFSSYERLKTDSRFLDIINLIIIGVILIIGINHLNMYFFRRTDRSNLYFGLVCLVMILRNVSTGDRILGFIISDINWELLVKLDNFSGFGTIPFFALFVYNLYKDDFNKRIRDILVIIGVAISLFVFVTPAIVYGKFRLLFEVYTLIGGLYLTFGVLLIASIRKRPMAIFAFFGLFILYATAVNDVLSSMGLIQTAYVAPYGLVAFMILQSVTITSKSAKAINENEVLSHQLEQEKHGLEERIEERTRELQQQHNELMAHQEKEKLQNWINVGLATINDVLAKNKHNFKLMSSNVLSSLAKYVDAPLGALYILNDDDPSDVYLELAADYGCGSELKKERKRVDLQSGIIGAAFSDNETKHITNIPDDFIKVKSGLGDSKPASVLIVPLSLDDSVFGAVELASLKLFKQFEIEFIQKIAYSMATNLNTLRMNERNVRLIEQFKTQASSIQEKEEQIRLSLEELEYYREQYETIKKKLDIGEKPEVKTQRKKSSKS